MSAGSSIANQLKRLVGLKQGARPDKPIPGVNTMWKIPKGWIEPSAPIRTKWGLEKAMKRIERNALRRVAALRGKVGGRMQSRHILAESIQDSRELMKRAAS